MEFYWFQYDTNGVLYPYLGTTAPSTTMGLLGPYPKDTASTLVVWAYLYPSRYLVVNGEIVAQPYFTLAATLTTGVYTISATLNDPPTPAPSTITFSVAGTNIASPLTNGAATLTVALHPSVAQQSILVGVSATGCVSSTLQLGGTNQNIGLQTVAINNVQTITPCGPGSLEFLSNYYADLIPIAANVTNMSVVIELLVDAVYNLLLPAAIAGTPVVPNASQSQILADIKSTLLPDLYTNMSNAYPSGGQRQEQYATMLTGFAGAKQVFEGYLNDVNTLPNLE